MSPQLRNVRARQIIAALEQDGFQKTHQTGSHATYRRGTRAVIVPVHSSGATIPIGTLQRIVAGAGWEEEYLRRLGLMRVSVVNHGPVAVMVEGCGEDGNRPRQALVLQALSASLSSARAQHNRIAGT